MAMKNRLPAKGFLCCLLLGGGHLPAAGPVSSDLKPEHTVTGAAEPVLAGKFAPTWESLRQYEAPEWFRDAKFGIWAHWGPQCQPEAGDWYARHMYVQGHWQNQAHVRRYGHPSVAGFKEVIRDWKAEKWDPDRLVGLYQRAGARYFFAMANHHDNLDLWASKHHAWNSMRVGPGKDLIAGWAKAARARGLPFGVSVHAAHAWSWYEVAQGADGTGEKAGLPYDGKLTAGDGKGRWWEGLDPRELYAQDHVPSPDFQDPGKIHERWNWGAGVSRPDEDYCRKFHDRCLDLINQCQPELLYFDDTALPLWPVSDAGLRIAAHFYNTNLAKTSGRDHGVLFGKILDESQLDCLAWDIERGVPNRILEQAWQTDTCIGGWHYDRGLYNRGHYKDARTVIHMLADITSKNGNLLLNIPVRGDGSIDDKAEAVLKGIGGWLEVNGEAIFGTRPWRTFGEGPATTGTELSAQGFNEGKGKPFTAEDTRYTMAKDGRVVYAIVMGTPKARLRLAALGTSAGPEVVRSVRVLGHPGEVAWTQEGEALVLEPVAGLPENALAISFRISL